MENLITIVGLIGRAEAVKKSKNRHGDQFIYFIENTLYKIYSYIYIFNILNIKLNFIYIE